MWEEGEEEEGRCLLSFESQGFNPVIRPSRDQKLLHRPSAPPFLSFSERPERANDIPSARVTWSYPYPVISWIEKRTKSILLLLHAAPHSALLPDACQSSSQSSSSARHFTLSILCAQLTITTITRPPSSLQLSAPCSAMSIVQSLLAVVAVVLTAVLVRRRYFSPLSDIPGPFVASFSASLWQLYHILTGHIEVAVIELHRKHGSSIPVRSHPAPLGTTFNSPTNRGIQARWSVLVTTR